MGSCGSKQREKDETEQGTESGGSGFVKKSTKNLAEGMTEETKFMQILKNLKGDKTQYMLQRKDTFAEYYAVGQQIGQGTFGEVRICKNRRST